MKILSNTMLTVFFLFIAGLVFHGMVNADDSINHHQLEHSLLK